MATKWIAGGAWVKIAFEINDIDVYIGLVTNASYDEDFQVSPANVLGFLGPADYDSQGYTCSITLGTLVPEADAPEGGTYPGGGSIALHSQFPFRDVIQLGGGKPSMFNTVKFLNSSTNEILVQFSQVMVASTGVQINPNSYVTANMRLMAIARVTTVTPPAAG